MAAAHALVLACTVSGTMTLAANGKPSMHTTPCYSQGTAICQQQQHVMYTAFTCTAESNYGCCVGGFASCFDPSDLTVCCRGLVVADLHDSFNIKTLFACVLLDTSCSEADGCVLAISVSLTMARMSFSVAAPCCICQKTC